LVFAAISKGRNNWRLPLEPLEYCFKWVPIYQDKNPGERGYRAACVRELAKISGVKESTIDINWGADFSERPSYLSKMLALADIINSMKQIFPLPLDSPSAISSMFEPLEPNEFCQKWVPIKSNKKLREYGYRKECRKLLAELTGYGETTCNNWLSTPSEIPRLVKIYLRSVDTLWQIQQLIANEVNNFKQ
jgi:hypothetical protein